MGSTFHKLRDDIENGILTGDFAPGARLDETQLAERFGVSRTPIREALMQLSAIGLIEFRPRRGALVADHGPKYVFEMFEVMAELEGMAGASAARRHTPEDKTLLLNAHLRCQEAAANEDTDAYYYENEAFHHVIYAASQNSFLSEQCAFLHRRLRPYRRLQLRVHNRMKASFDEHKQIIEKILAGDAPAARELLLAHVKIQGDRFGDLIASLEKIKAKATQGP